MIIFGSITVPLANPSPRVMTVDRWYQLDSPSLALTEFGARLHNRIPHPEGMIVGSTGGSNETDRQFVESGYLSPQKFAHTLPNVRMAPFCEVLDWMGPVFCVQNDPATFVAALREGIDSLFRWKSVWVTAISKGAELPRNDYYEIAVIYLTKDNQVNFNPWLGLSETQLWEAARGTECRL